MKTLMDEELGVVCVATFSDDNYYKSVGIFVCDVEHDNADEDGCDNFLFNTMGFKNSREYIDSYPGKFLGWSAVSNIIRGKHVRTRKSEIYTNISTSIIAFKEDIDEIIRMLESGCNLFIVSTKKQLRDNGSEYFKKMKQKDMWFCSDWKEPKEK